MIGFKQRIEKGLELKSENPFFVSFKVTVPRKTNQAKSNGRVLWESVSSVQSEQQVASHAAADATVEASQKHMGSAFISQVFFKSS